MSLTPGFQMARGRSLYSPTQSPTRVDGMIAGRPDKKREWGGGGEEGVIKNDLGSPERVRKTPESKHK